MKMEENPVCAEKKSVKMEKCFAWIRFHFLSHFITLVIADVTVVFASIVTRNVGIMVTFIPALYKTMLELQQGSAAT